MVGGLGGGNGFMFRTRRQEDAEAFVQEFQGRAGPRRSSRAGIAGVVVVIVILVALGLIGWLS